MYIYIYGSTSINCCCCRCCKCKLACVNVTLKVGKLLAAKKPYWQTCIGHVNVHFAATLVCAILFHRGGFVLSVLLFPVNCDTHRFYGRL